MRQNTDQKVVSPLNLFVKTVIDKKCLKISLIVTRLEVQFVPVKKLKTKQYNSVDNYTHSGLFWFITFKMSIFIVRLRKENVYIHVLIYGVLCK